ncbi:MAG: hypothetical protein AB1489_40165 [Acidobacteriota bacterium]
MVLYYRLVFLGLFLLVLLLGLPLPVKASPLEVKLANQIITLELVKDNECFSPVEWPSEEISLNIIAEVIEKDERVFDLLKTNGIHPDVEAYSLLYDLNPNLKKIDPLPSGDSIKLPSIKGGEQLKEKLRNGHIIVLTVNKQLKDELSALAIKINSLYKQIKIKQNNSNKTKQKLIDYLADLADWFLYIRNKFLQRTGPPLRYETFLQIRNEAELLTHLMEKMLNSNRHLTRLQKNQIIAIHKDIELDIDKYENQMSGALPDGEPLYKVVVCIKGKNEERIKSIRVYYIANGLFREPLTNPPVDSLGFPNLGSGASKELPIKNYKIWGAKDGDPLHPLTTIFYLEVRPRDIDLNVDLTLLR